MSSFSSKAMADCSFLAGPRTIVPPGPTPPVVDKHFDFVEWSPGRLEMKYINENYRQFMA